MRSIELRAWDKNKNRYVKFDPSIFTEGYGQHTNPEYKTNNNEILVLKSEWFCCDKYDVIWEQWTGLYDKNEKKIFEGDMVKSNKHNPNIFMIEFLEGGFCATYGDEDSSMPIDINHFFDSTGCMIEVIGNIHQNPKLLGGVK